MEEIVLSGKSRKVIGKQVRALRRQGYLPAVIYGYQISPMPIMLEAHATNRKLSSITSSQLVTVEVDGIPHTTLVKQRQRHAITGALLHVDFQAVSMTEKLQAAVVLELIGEAPAVKNYSGVLVTGQEKLEVECLPKYLPDRIVIDLSILEHIGDAIYVRDIKLQQEIEVLTDLNEMIALITAPTVEAELEVAEAGEGEPEMIERGKKEEEIEE